MNLVKQIKNKSWSDKKHKSTKNNDSNRFGSFSNTAQKMNFSIKDFFTFTEEILNGKLRFF